MLSTDKHTKTQAVMQWVRERIEWQVYQPHQKIPSIRALASKLGVSSFTVSNAYEQLVATNWLEARAGSGYYVRAQQLPEPAKQKPKSNQAPVLDTRWLMQQMFSEVPAQRAPGSGVLPNTWVQSDKMLWALRQVAQEAETFVYEYGDIQGYLPLRQQLTAWLDGFGMNCHPDTILTTAGVSQAVDMVARHLLTAGDAVLVDEPSWFWLSSALQQQGVRVYGVARDAQGPDIEQMRQLFVQHRPKLYLTNSVLHNPTSYNLHPARAHQVINLIHEHQAYIFEDDLFAAFDASGSALRYATLDQFARVFYATGFSKALAAGWRVGLLVCPESQMQAMLRVKMLSNMTTPEFGERVVHRLWTQGDYRKQTKRITELLYSAHQWLRQELPKLGIDYPDAAQAGIFLWVDVGVDTSRLALHAHQAGWLVAPGQLFYPDGRASTHLRLNVATTTPEFLHWLAAYLAKTPVI